MKSSEIVAGNSAFGVVKVRVNVLGSTTLTPLISVAVPARASLAPTSVFNGAPYTHVNVALAGFRHRSNENLTSSAVKGWPSCQVRPLRRWNVQVSLSADTSQDSARSPVSWS